MTTRAGGASREPFDSLNLKAGLGDDDEAVAVNQARLRDVIGAEPVWLDQVHGRTVVRLGAPEPGRPCADASLSTEPGVACVVQVADCLPVLYAAPGARGVAAAHAGWRGLAAGVLETTLDALCEATGCAPHEVQVWLGACIGPRRFEVGADVLEAFGADPGSAAPPRFVPERPGKWLADLPGLARDRLAAAGVRAVSGGQWCTVEDRSRFFSFRRDGRTGRMAAAVWLEPR
ncbi:MAG: peptidoglycan editing factor PgeF [Piscinibacter sp.]|nr:peptidoglycan editing factor PgeF [Piscinibacter sp.]